MMGGVLDMSKSDMGKAMSGMTGMEAGAMGTN
ncbi:MAG: hypothetical protein CM15mP31_4140 [Gammaproteobacteria bacterium]|nr:MAG: hypothetical protein CM15mP31_4140 [Gammaproteobacteria bacterium]